MFTRSIGLDRKATAVAVGTDGLAHVREHQVFDADLLHRPRRVMDRLVGAHEQCALAVGVAGLDDPLALWEGVGVPAGSYESAVCREQIVDLACELDVRGGEQDQVVAHPL
jgi:hypothetical protein